MHLRYLVPALLVFAFESSVVAQAPHSCVVIVDDDTGATFRTDAEACRTRLSPASTFKIPHALVALETGAVTVDSVERWDGTPHSA